MSFTFLTFQSFWKFQQKIDVIVYDPHTVLDIIYWIEQRTNVGKKYD